jgi:hypothetical protein
MVRAALLTIAFAFVWPSAAFAQSLILIAKHSSKCAQVNGASNDNGAAVSQWDCVNQPNVHWRKVYLGGGLFQLKARHSGKCAQVNGASHANGAIVSQWTCVDQRNVKWRERPAGGGYVYLVNNESGKCMQVNGPRETTGRPSASGTASTRTTSNGR